MEIRYTLVLHCTVLYHLETSWRGLDGSGECWLRGERDGLLDEVIRLRCTKGRSMRFV